ncbi:DUF317 domain-containing protein [Streptomyces sp. NPDC059373]
MTIASTTPFHTPSAAVLLVSDASGSAPAEGRDWLIGGGIGNPVTDFLLGQGWSVVSDDLANVHCSSPDGRVYVGFLPEIPDNYQRRILWRVSVSAPGGGIGWTQTFGSDTPSEAVAGFLAALIATPNR